MKYLRFGEESVLEDMSPEELYLCGLEGKEWDTEIAKRLGTSGDGEYIYRAGVKWSDERWHPGLAHSLIGSGDMYWIRAALGRDKTLTPWPEQRRNALLRAWQGY